MTAGAAVLLDNVNLGGVQQTVSWETSLDSEGNLEGGGDLSNGNPTGIPATGVGTVAPVSPGFRSTLGYYSFTGNFGMVAATSIQDSAFTDINSVVFQRVSMLNPDYTAQQSLDFGGGATLSLYSYGVLVDTISATNAFVGDSFSGGGSGFSGTYYNYTYEWDLSGYSQEITSVSINSPITVHSSTVEAQIDISSNSLQAIPEPTSAMLGAVASAFLLIRRRQR